MIPAVRIVRTSNTIKALEEQHIAQVSTAIREARRMLADHPCPDTFLGRKTQEPFPMQDEAEV
jgi:hypothetical protein